MGYVYARSVKKWHGHWRAVCNHTLSGPFFSKRSNVWAAGGWNVSHDATRSNMFHKHYAIMSPRLAKEQLFNRTTNALSLKKSASHANPRLPLSVQVIHSWMQPST